jgi:hypothetical protein
MRASSNWPRHLPLNWPGGMPVTTMQCGNGAGRSAIAAIQEHEGDLCNLFATHHQALSSLVKDTPHLQRGIVRIAEERPLTPAKSPFIPCSSAAFAPRFYVVVIEYVGIRSFSMSPASSGSPTEMPLTPDLGVQSL